MCVCVWIYSSTSYIHLNCNQNWDGNVWFFVVFGTDVEFFYSALELLWINLSIEWENSCIERNLVIVEYVCKKSYFVIDICLIVYPIHIFHLASQVYLQLLLIVLLEWSRNLSKKLHMIRSTPIDKHKFWVKLSNI